MKRKNNNENSKRVLEPEVRQEYIEKSMRIMSNKKIRIGTAKDLKKLLKS